MTISLEELYRPTSKKYRIQIKAGDAGLNKIVDWTHSIEDRAVARFLHGNELIFTTGIAHQDDSEGKWLLELVKDLHKAQASGLIVNYGGYIKTVPYEVIEFCEQVGFPLFVMPWETKIVDVTRYYCDRIIEAQEKVINLGESCKQFIFHPELRDEIINVFREHGIKPIKSCQLLFFSIDNQNNFFSANKSVRLKIGSIIHRERGQYLSFEDGKYLVYVLFEFLKPQIDRIQKRVLEEIQLNHSKKIRMTVGRKEENIFTLSEHYKENYRLVNVTKNQNQDILYYENMGIFELILSSDMNLMTDYYKNRVGKLEQHDQAYQTQYITLLQYYLTSKMSIQELADILHVHRNTINYQLNQISTILDVDLKDLSVKLELLLALKIADMIK